MNEFKKNIFRTEIETDPAPPEPYEHTVASGSYVCVGGFVNITGETNITVYSNKLIADLIVGDMLYSDVGLTVLTTATFIQTQTGGDLFITMSTPGVIDTIEAPGTAC